MTAFHKLNHPRPITIRPLVLATFFAVLLLTSRATNAEPITLTIDPPPVTTIQGVLFTGTIQNNTGVSLMATDLFFNFNNFSPEVLTPTQLLGSSQFILGNGATSPAVDLFSVTFSSSAAPGTYMIEAFLQDANDNLSNIITVNVSVNGGTPVPEPTTILLFGSGLVGAITVRRKRRNDL